MLARRPDLAALALLALAVCLFFWDVLLGPRVLLPADVLYTVAPWSGLPEAAAHPVPHNALIGDAILQNVAWKSFARAALAGGQLPLWNPYQFAGMPFMAGGQSGSIYPLGVLFYLLPVERAYGPFMALHLYLGGAFAYAFARVLGARPAAALLGGLTFAFSAFLIVSFTWPMIVSAAIWLPLLLLFVELIVGRAERGGSTAGLAALALFGGCLLGLQILAGHLEITFYAAFALLFYALVRLALGPLRAGQLGDAGRAFAALALMGLLGPALAAVQILPFFELIGQNFRSGFVDLPTVLSYALPPWQVATFLIPDFFGNPSHHGYFSLLERAWQPAPPGTDPPRTIWWGFPKNYVEAAAYLGLLPLALALAALPLVRTRQVAALAALGLWSLLLAFGSRLYALLFLAIPGVDQLHTPFRWIYPYSVVVAVLAALGAEGLARRPSIGWARAGAALGALGALGAAGALAVAAAPLPFLGLAEAALQRSGRLRRAFDSPDMLLSYQWRSLAIFAGLLLATGVVLALLARRPRPALALGCALVAGDLFLAHYGFNSRADPAPIRAVPPTIALLRADPEPFRVVAMADGDALTPITAMLSGVEDVRGYDTVIPRRYVELWSLIEPPRGLEYSKLQGLARVESLDSPLLRLLNVRYVLATAPVASPALELAHQGDAFVYRLRDPLPRAFVVPSARSVADDAQALRLLGAPGFDPRRELIVAGPAPSVADGRAGEARWLERGPNRLRLSADGPGYLLVTDFHFPGWRASVDGQPAELLRADHVFRAVALGPGQHTVELRYRPDSVLVGGLVSGLAFLGVLVGLAACAWPTVAGRRGADTPAARVARNALSGMGTQLVNKAIDFGFAIVMLRWLEAEGIGRYALAIAISGYLEIWSNFGLNALVIRDGAQRPERLGAIGGSSLLLRLALWLVGLPVIGLALVAWRRWLGMPDDALAATILLSLALVPGNVAATYSALFYARERVEVPAGLTVATTIGKVGLGLAALLLGQGIVGLAAVALLGNVATALALGAIAHRTGVVGRLSASTAEARAMLRPAFPLMLNHLLATLFFRIDVLLLQPLRGNRELGYYATAYKFVDGLGIIPSAFTFAVFPQLARLAAGEPDALRRAYALSLKLLVFVSVPLALAMTALAEPLVGLVGGPDYLPDAAVALRLLIWFLPLSFANGLTQYALVAAGQQRAITSAFVGAVAFNVLANLATIPIYGYRAAAVVTVLSEVALAVPFGLVVARAIGLSPARAVGPFLIAAALALAALLGVEVRLGPAAGLAAGLAVYLAALALLRPLDADERQRLARVLRRRQNRAGALGISMLC
jgi:O-antigen/teichoic acid export membrane protein